MSSGGRPGRRKCALSSAALCATCCSRVYSCAPQPPLPESAPLQRRTETSGLHRQHLALESSQASVLDELRTKGDMDTYSALALVQRASTTATLFVTVQRRWSWLAAWPVAGCGQHFSARRRASTEAEQL
jgi:hypothetical protein